MSYVHTRFSLKFPRGFLFAVDDERNNYDESQDSAGDTDANCNGIVTTTTAAAVCSRSLDC